MAEEKLKWWQKLHEKLKKFWGKVKRFVKSIFVKEKD